eukprot:CAMPEP_0184306122 /NCGR_PEP_ID=MMETSP1049-20130417/15210_1 /TAXON_ID=77928 /ORGANISM="Proteomonas sulcata, Strain CCMP704" /LENGTH=332 /DNA_ID=CAMNT_0026618317 /DNA_START=39 /DNA_END=1034 /DNA_ORIENTATION=+
MQRLLSASSKSPPDLSKHAAEKVPDTVHTVNETARNEEVDLDEEDVLYDKDIDDRVAEARSWDEIKIVTKEYLNKLQLENEDQTGVMDMMKAFDEEQNLLAKKKINEAVLEDAEEPDLVPEVAQELVSLEANASSGASRMHREETISLSDPVGLGQESLPSTSVTNTTSSLENSTQSNLIRENTWQDALRGLSSDGEDPTQNKTLIGLQEVEEGRVRPDWQDAIRHHLAVENGTEASFESEPRREKLTVHSEPLAVTEQERSASAAVAGTPAAAATAKSRASRSDAAATPAMVEDLQTTPVVVDQQQTEVDTAHERNPVPQTSNKTRADSVW